MTYRNVVEHASHAIGKASIFINFSNSEHERTSIHEYIRLFFYFFFFSLNLLDVNLFYSFLLRIPNDSKIFAKFFLCEFKIFLNVIYLSGLDYNNS